MNAVKPSRAANLALLVASTMLALLIAEAAVRALWSGQWSMPRDAVRQESVFAAQFRSDIETTIPLADGGGYSVRTNARGFRGPAVASLADRKLRVVSIGDSFAFGWGIDESRHALQRWVNDYARAHVERDIALATVATGGWAPDDYLYAFLTEVKPAKVDLVVLGIFAGNDVLPADHPRSLVPAPRPVASDAPPGPWYQPRLIDFVKTQLSGILLANRLAIKLGYVPESFRRFVRDDAYQKKYWATTFFYLDALVREVRASGAEIAFISYPSSIQVNAPDAIDGPEYSHTMPDQVLQRYCNENAIPFISPLESLKAANGRRDLYFPIDRHLNQNGHEVLLTVLKKELTPVVDAARERRKNP